MAGVRGPHRSGPSSPSSSSTPGRKRPSAASAHFDPDGGAVRRTNTRGLRAWAGDPSAATEESLTPREAAVEGLWTGLRLLTGVDVDAYLARFGAVDRQWLVRRCERGVDRGNLVWSAEGRRLSVAPGRWLFHDEICAALM